MLIRHLKFYILCTSLILLTACEKDRNSEQTAAIDQGPSVYFSNWQSQHPQLENLPNNPHIELITPIPINSDGSADEVSSAVHRNLETMRSADLLIANMTPQKAPSLNVITAFEMGFVFGLNKPILAYTADPRPLTIRTIEHIHSRGKQTQTIDNDLKDEHGNSIEQFGLIDNLMLDGAVDRSGGVFTASLMEAVAAASKLLASDPASHKKPARNMDRGTSNQSPEIYMAGPDVFFPNPIDIANKNKAASLQLGFKGNFPLDNELDLSGTPQENGFMIFDANINLMKRSDIILANMVEFRSQYMDPGTAFEMGFMRALERPVIGYGGSTSPSKTTFRTEQIYLGSILSNTMAISYEEALQKHTSGEQ